MELGIVTTVWGAYGHWLPEWVASIESQNTRPAQVTVVDSGVDDIAPGLAALRASSLNWRLLTLEHAIRGASVNAAMEITPTEWVMHLDADDYLLPGALEEFASVAQPGVDVISAGAERIGKAVLYPHVTTETVAQGHNWPLMFSPYRRSWWERSPYPHSDYIHVAFFQGIARLGAVFAATDFPCVVYRDNPESMSYRLAADPTLFTK